MSQFAPTNLVKLYGMSVSKPTYSVREEPKDGKIVRVSHCGFFFAWWERSVVSADIDFAGTIWVKGRGKWADFLHDNIGKHEWLWLTGQLRQIHEGGKLSPSPSDDRLMRVRYPKRFSREAQEARNEPWSRRKHYLLIVNVKRDETVDRPYLESVVISKARLTELETLARLAKKAKLHLQIPEEKAKALGIDQRDVDSEPGLTYLSGSELEELRTIARRQVIERGLAKPDEEAR